MQNNCNKILELYKEILSDKELFLDIGNVNKNNIKNFLEIKKSLKNNIKKLKEIILGIYDDKQVCLEIYRNFLAGNKIVEDDFLDNIKIPEKPKGGKWRLLFMYGNIDYDYMAWEVGFDISNITDYLLITGTKTEKEKSYAIWVEDTKDSRAGMVASTFFSGKTISSIVLDNAKRITKNQKTMDTMSVDEYVLFLYFKFKSGEDWQLDSSESCATVFINSYTPESSLVCKLDSNSKKIEIQKISNYNTLPPDVIPRFIMTC